MRAMRRVCIFTVACLTCLCRARRVHGLPTRSTALDTVSADARSRRLQALLLAINGQAPARSNRELMSAFAGERQKERLLTPSASPRRALAQMTSDSSDDLPSNAILVKEPDEAIWNDEVLEFNGIVTDPNAPVALQAYLRSFKASDGSYCHAYDGAGVPLSAYEAGFEKAQGDSCPVLDDAKRLRLIFGLLESVNYLHDRGSAHLALDSNVVRIAPKDISKPEGDVELRIIGLGAAVKLGRKGRTNFQMNEDIAYYAPELLNSPILSSNLEALYQLDSWSVGVLIVMLAAGLTKSPFEASKDWTKGFLTDERAVSQSIDDSISDWQFFITKVEEASCGLVFRHGWVAKLITGLLQKNPKDRLSIADALDIATDGLQPTGVSIGELSSTIGLNDNTISSGSLATDAAAALVESIIAGGIDRSKYRTKPKKGKSGEPFRRFEAILSIVGRGKSSITMQNRSDLPDVRNYGELIGFRNKNSGERWDVFVPALDLTLPRDTPIRLKRLLGVILVPGGNHKLVVEAQALLRPDEKRIEADVAAFTRMYAERKNIDVSQIRYLNYEEIKL